MWRPEREALHREPLEALQLQGMRTTLARALGQPNHARRLAGAHPHDVARVEDWARLPFLTKEELRDAYPFGLACGRREDYRRIQMSSGTTGHPIVNPYTAGDVEQWGEVMALCYVAAGVTAADAGRGRAGRGQGRARDRPEGHAVSSWPGRCPASARSTAARASRGVGDASSAGSPRASDRVTACGGSAATCRSC